MQKQKMNLAQLASPFYFGAVTAVLVFIVLSWRVPAGKPTTPTRYSLVVTSAIISAVVGFLSKYASPSATAEIFDTNPPGF